MRASAAFRHQRYRLSTNSSCTPLFQTAVHIAPLSARVGSLRLPRAVSRGAPPASSSQSPRSWFNPTRPPRRPCVVRRKRARVAPVGTPGSGAHQPSRRLEDQRTANACHTRPPMLWKKRKERGTLQPSGLGSAELLPSRVLCVWCVCACCCVLCVSV